MSLLSLLRRNRKEGFSLTGHSLAMTDYEKIYDFNNLYNAHRSSRRGKRNKAEVIEFEMHLSEELTMLSNALKAHQYRMEPYYHFYVYEPKQRSIHALHYRDRVVQHCVCDEILMPLLERRLIYDNAACRRGKGTHFAIYRLTHFLQEYYKKYGYTGYFLKCDIRHYFDNIDHDVLKNRMTKVIKDRDVLNLLFMIIDSYETKPQKGLPLGNQTSQWFALYYLDGLDRLVKEKLHIKYYSRYMDDIILVYPDKEYLKYCLSAMKQYIEKELQLEFNEKTQIIPFRNGVEYLGFRFYLTKTGKVVRKLKPQAKKRYKNRMKELMYQYKNDEISRENVEQSLASFRGYLQHGHTYRLRKNTMRQFVLRK